MFITATAIKGLISSCIGFGFIGVMAIAVVKPTWLGIPQYTKNYVLIMHDNDLKGVATVFNADKLDKLENFKCTFKSEKAPEDAGDGATKEDTDCKFEKIKVDLSNKWIDLDALSKEAKLEVDGSGEVIEFFYKLKISSDIANAIPWTSNSSIEVIDTTPKEEDNAAVNNKSAFTLTTAPEQQDPPAQPDSLTIPPTGSPGAVDPTEADKEKPKVLATIVPQFSIKGKAIKDNGYFGYIAKAKEFKKAVVPVVTPVPGAGTDTSLTGETGGVKAKSTFLTQTTLFATVDAASTEEPLEKATIVKKNYLKCSDTAPTNSAETKSESATKSITQCWISDFSKNQTEVADGDYKQHKFNFAKYYSRSIKKNHLYVVRPQEDKEADPKLDQTTLHMQIFDKSTTKPVVEGVGTIEFENLVPVFVYPFGTNAMAFVLNKASGSGG